MPRDSPDKAPHNGLLHGVQGLTVSATSLSNRILLSRSSNDKDVKAAALDKMRELLIAQGTEGMDPDRLFRKISMAMFSLGCQRFAKTTFTDLVDKGFFHRNGPNIVCTPPIDSESDQPPETQPTAPVRAVLQQQDLNLPITSTMAERGQNILVSDKENTDFSNHVESKRSVDISLMKEHTVKPSPPLTPLPANIMSDIHSNTVGSKRSARKQPYDCTD
ncbi:hypothetical protein K439DRAFT_1617290 [Ramaria rubella]|nr:hypothetical protein K439DRAFT_1617290 [Ramaria rubella]